MSTTRISIISHTYGRFEHIRNMIESVRTMTPPNTYEIIVVASDPPETEKVRWLKQQSDVIFIQADIRKPWQLRKRSAYYYVNLGIKKARHPWVVVFNDDMRAGDGWFQAFADLVMNPANSNMGMIIASTQIGKMRYGKTIPVIGKTKKPGQNWKDLPLADMAIMRKDVLERVGMYDEQIDWAGGGADLALAFEFLSNTDIVMTDSITIDHLVAKENRHANLTNDLAGTYYVEQKWQAWCAGHSCQYVSNTPPIPYTLLNRAKEYTRQRVKILRHYWRYITTHFSSPR